MMEAVRNGAWAKSEEVPYIETDGFCYIDTEIPCGKTDNRETYQHDSVVYVPHLETSAIYHILSQTENVSYGEHSALVYLGFDNFKYTWRKENIVYSASFSTNKTSSLQFVGRSGYQKSIFDGVESQSSAALTVAAGNFELFGYGGLNYLAPKGTRLYLWKISLNGSVIADLVPARASDGQGCLFNVITGTYHHNLGSGRMKVIGAPLYVEN